MCEQDLLVPSSFHHSLLTYMCDLIYTSRTINITRDLISSVFEIKDFFYAPTGCTGKENRAPGYLFMCTFLYKGIHTVEKTCTLRMHRRSNLCTRQPKCAHRVQGAPLISNTDHRDNAVIYVAFVMLIWSAPIPADRWYCSL